MPFEMLKIAQAEGIKVEYWDFEPPLDGIYAAGPSIPPVIGVSNRLFECSPRFRCVLAEELGHHYTTTINAIPQTFFHYRDRLEVSRAEYRALRWAAEYLIPKDRLESVIKNGVVHRWELAELFNVTEEMVDFRLGLPKEA